MAQLMNKDLNKLAPLEIGFEIEFYSNKTRAVIARELSNIIKKKIYVSDETEVTETKLNNVFILEPDFLGGSKMCQLYTSVMPYLESTIVLNKILSYIKTSGWTDDKCSLNFGISFNDMKTPKMFEKIQNLNKLKYCLGINEKFIHEKFPNRPVFARSIKTIHPINKFVFSDKFDSIIKENYEIPNQPYYAVNFKNLYEGYFEVRYIGGKHYEKKAALVQQVIDYIGEYTYNVLESNNTYTQQECDFLKKKITEHKKVVSSFSDVDSFFSNYPDMNILVDLKGDYEIIKTYYSVVREKLFDLIVKSNIKRGILNYDSDVAKYQLKEAFSRKAYPIYNIELFESKLTGSIINCDLYGCEIRNSHILNCNIKYNNVIKRSRIVASPINRLNEINDSFIDNKQYIIEGTITGGVIKSGDVSEFADITETEILNKLK
jgi:hypothetical protein